MLGICPRSGATYIFYCVGNRSFEDLKREGLGRFKEKSPKPHLNNRSLWDDGAWTRIAYFTPSFIRVDPWVGNGVALLGDSAHTFHPHAGQGVNLSLQDALVLADVITDALSAGDTSRRNCPNTSRVGECSRRDRTTRSLHVYLCTQQ